jgi:hypothetical protein
MVSGLVSVGGGGSEEVGEQEGDEERGGGREEQLEEQLHGSRVDDEARQPGSGFLVGLGRPGKREKERESGKTRTGGR